MWLSLRIISIIFVFVVRDLAPYSLASCWKVASTILRLMWSSFTRERLFIAVSASSSKIEDYKILSLKSLNFLGMSFWSPRKRSLSKRDTLECNLGYKYV